MKNILIVEDHVLTTMGLGLLIKRVIPDSTIYSASSFEQSLEELRNNRMDLVILDLGVPGGRGPAMIGTMRHIQKEVRILVCSGRDEIITAPNMINAGANGFLSKSALNSEAEKALQMVMADKKYLSDAVKEIILDHFVNNQPLSQNPIDLLSPREKEIMDQMLQGKGNKEIASELNIKFPTVSTHKQRIFQKMDVENIVELMKKVAFLTDETKGAR